MTLRPGCVERCPGCAHRELPARESEAKKSEWLARALEPWRSSLEPMRAVSGEGRWGYRGKTCLRARWESGEWKLGLLVRDRFGNEEVIAIPECPVHAPFVREVVASLLRVLPAGDGFPLAFVLVSGRFLTLVVKSHECAELGWISALDPARLGLEGVFVNFNPAAGERVLAHRGWKLLWGRERGELELTRLFPGESVAYGPDSFSQLIPSLYEDSVIEARSFLSIGEGDSVVDLCSGIGVSLKLWKKGGAEALGVELGEESVACADQNAGHGSSLRGRASERLPQLREWVRGRARVLAYANPPRLGLEPEVTDWLGGELRPARIAYLSCSAGTLARDLDRLSRAGYAVRRLIPYDFFPQTSHVECLALLELS